MQELSLQELIYVFKIIGYFVGIIGGIIVIGLGVIGYVYKSDRMQNRVEHSKLFEKTDENTECIKYIKGRLKL